MLKNIVKKYFAAILAAVALVAFLPVTDIQAAELNPESNSINDFAYDKNETAPGRWSYYYVKDADRGIDAGVVYLVKGDGAKFSDREYAVDISNSNHVWCIEDSGKFFSDLRPMAWNYTINEQMADAPLGVNLKGSISATRCRLQICRTTETKANTAAGPVEILYDEVKEGHDFDVTIPAGTLKPGNDIIFIVTKAFGGEWWLSVDTSFTVKAMYAEQAAAPVCSPAETMLDLDTPVSLSTETDGAQIFYTTDGTDPKTSATKKEYTEPLILEDYLTLKCYAAKSGMESSYVSTKKYFPNFPIRDYLGAQGMTEAFPALKYARADIVWSSIEPEQGKYDNDALDSYLKSILKSKENGVISLPIFQSGNSWATKTDGITYKHEQSGYTFEFDPVPSGQTGSTKRAYDRWGNLVFERSYSNVGLNEKNVADWQNFIRDMLSILTKEPYNMKYFQIGNEAYPESGFYYAGLDHFMEYVYIPAAKVMREFDGVQIVYGGWPCCGTAFEFVELMDKFDAWQYIDVFDVHYHPLQTMEYIYQEAVKRGYDVPPVWQTEFGLTSAVSYPNNMYSRTLRWAMERGMFSQQESKAKMFWFAAWAPDDPNAYAYNSCLMSSDHMSDVGRSISAFTEIMKARKLEPFNNYKTTPFLRPEINEQYSSSQGYLLDDKRVALNVQLIKQSNYSSLMIDRNTGLLLDLNDPDTTLGVEIHGIRGDVTVKRLDVFGNSMPLSYKRLSDDAIFVNVPTKEPIESTQELMDDGSLLRSFWLVADSTENIEHGDLTTPSY